MRKPDTELNVTGFCDASWQCVKDDTKSQTGYVFVVNGGAVDWKNKKQTTIAMSVAQAEYMAALEAAIEAVCILWMLQQCGGGINDDVFFQMAKMAKITVNSFQDRSGR
ncbi:retrotransposon protein, putative, ty1-copia subclass [Tanacetum coccineum]